MSLYLYGFLNICMYALRYCGGFVIYHHCPIFPHSQLKEEVRQAKCSAAERSDLQAQLEEARRQASLLEGQLVERGVECRELASLRRELEDLRTLTQSQEQRVAQSHREAQQSQAELSSLEAILALLHLREVDEHRHTH